MGKPDFSTGAVNSTEIPQDNCSLHTHPSLQFMKRCKIAGWQQARWKVRLFWGRGVAVDLQHCHQRTFFPLLSGFLLLLYTHHRHPPPPQKKWTEPEKEHKTKVLLVPSFSSLGTNQTSEYTYYIGMWVTVEWAFCSQLCHFIALPARLFQAPWITEWILPGAGKSESTTQKVTKK